MASVAVLSWTPAGAAGLHSPAASAERAIIQAGYSRDRHRNYYRHGGRRYGHYRRHHRHHDFSSGGFYFGFPFSILPPYYSYHPRSYGNCFRTWDGQLLCR